jgi:hypothetical protein
MLYTQRELHVDCKSTLPFLKPPCQLIAIAPVSHHNQYEYLWHSHVGWLLVADKFRPRSKFCFLLLLYQSTAATKG